MFTQRESFGESKTPGQRASRAVWKFRSQTWKYVYVDLARR